MNGADVRAIESLDELRTALLRFQSDTTESLHVTQSAARRALEWLQSRLTYWKNELAKRLQILAQAERALDQCIRASQYARSQGGGGFDCSDLQAEVYRARRAVQEARQELQVTQQYLKQVQEAFDMFQREAYQLTNMMSNELSRGTNLLQRSREMLSRYASSGSGSGFAGGAIGGLLAGGVATVGSLVAASIASVLGGNKGNATATLPPGLSMVQMGDQGAFSVLDWSGYPSVSGVPRPPGPFRLLSDSEYKQARVLGNKGSQAFRAARGSDAEGKQVHHIHPIKFGGNPTDWANLVLLTPEQHQLYTVWWNKVLVELKAQGAGV